MNNAYPYRKLINDYWFQTVENPQSFDECDQYLDGKIKSIPEGKSFMFFTDTHNKCGYAGQTPAIMGYITETTGIKKVISGSDFLDREATRYIGVQYLMKAINEHVAVSGKDLIMVFGNHDVNTANAPEDKVKEMLIPYTELEKVLFNHMEGRVTEDITKRFDLSECTEEDKTEILAFSRLHYYVDDDETKIRYIIVETGNQFEYERNGCISNYFDVYNNEDLVLQYDWLYETLMSTPEDYDVVVSGHALLGYGAGAEKIWPGPLGLCHILSGFKTCSKISVENPFPYYEKLAKYYAKGEHVYDFTSRRHKSNVVVIAGDVHWDVQTKADYDENGNFVSSPYVPGKELPETAVVVNVVQTDGMGSCNYLEKTYKMQKGTITEQCFDVVTVLPNGNIKLTRIGAGENREVLYK